MMRKLIFLIILSLAAHIGFAQDIWISKNATVNFFSSTVVEDIEAKSNTGASVINAKSGEIIFKVSNTSFRFPKKLMEEHFNENYMESDKFSYSEFKGKISGAFNTEKDGNYQVTVSGNLSIHGVAKAYSVPATISVSKGTLSAKTVFKVRIADHGIKVPSLVFKNIAETIDVKIQASYLPKQ